MATRTDLAQQLREDLAAEAPNFALELQVRKHVATTILTGGPSVALERLPERAAVDLAYAEVEQAAEAGNEAEALKLFRRALLRKGQLHDAASEETDRQRERVFGLKVPAEVVAQLERLAETAGEETPPAPALPRAARRAQIRAQRKARRRAG